MFSFMTTFVLCFMMGNSYEAFTQNAGLGLSYYLVLSPFSGNIAPMSRGFTLHKKHVLNNKLIISMSKQSP
jgi:hypothetical protein